MGTRYSTITISGYNASSPADDGSQVASNQITWAKSKTKLGDPLKTAIESINSSLVTALDMSVRTVTSNDSLTAADHLKTIQCTATSAGFAVSLGDAATMAAGYIVTVHNRGSSTGDVTVNLSSASDSINNVTNGTRLLPPGSALTFIIASPTSGYLINGSDGVLKSPFWVDVSGVLKRLTFAGDVSFPAIAAKGDILSGSAAGALAVTTAGTAGQILSPDSAQTGGLVWRDNIVLGTPTTSASTTTIDVTSIPAWAKRVTILFAGVSTNGTSQPLVQIGDSGGIEPTGYLGSSCSAVNASATIGSTFTTGFGIHAINAGNVMHGAMTLTLADSSTNTWVASHSIGYSNTSVSSCGGGSKSLSGVLDRVRITTVNGTDAYDLGLINVVWE